MKMKNRVNWRNRLKWWQKWLIILCVSLLVSCGSEALQVICTKKNMEQSGAVTGTELIPSEYISFQGNGRMEGDIWVSEQGSVVVELPTQYINKVLYYYETTEPYEIDIKVTTRNEYGVEEEIEILDSLITNARNSIVNIQAEVSRIEMEFPVGVRVKTFTILNDVDFNSYRVLFLMTFCVLLLFIFLFLDFICQKIEYAFLIFGLGIGVLFIALQPPRGMSWDEHIHMYKCFDLFDTGEIPWSESEEYMYTNLESTNKAPFLSREEKALQILYLNEADDHITYSYERNGYSLAEFGYVFVAAVMRIGEMLGMSFYNIYLLGKLANLFMYIVVMFFAIKITPICKKTLTVMGLMPTPMLLATAYSYDTVVISFISLGTALLVRELLRPKEQIRWRTVILIIGCFVVGSIPKILYLPLVLALLTLPSAKFKNKKTIYVLRGISLGLCLLGVIALMLLVTLGVVSGDVRGGETSVMGQMQLVLHHPFVYAEILAKNILRTFSGFFLGEEALAHLAFAGRHSWRALISLLIFGVLFTESRTAMTADQKNAISQYRKIMIPLNVGIIILIWTALYLDFTVLGSSVISGVQARYYLPMFLSFFVLLYTDKIRCTWNNKKYTAVMLSLVVFIWMQCLYTMFLVPYCL